MTETALQASIRKAVGLLPHVRLFRNNRGVAWMGEVVSQHGGLTVLRNARPVEFGLIDGASDLIGLAQLKITEAHLGATVAVFTAAEVKVPGVTVPKHQQRFVDFVRGFGGRADVVRSPEDVLRLVGTP